MIETEESRPRAGSLLSVALVLGVLADGLLFDQGVGIGGTLFLLALPAALLGLLRRNQVRPAWGSLFPLLGSYGFFAVMLTVRASGFLTDLNLLACLFLLGLLARFTVPGQLGLLRLGELLGAPFVLLGACLKRAAPAVATVAEAIRQGESRRSAGPLLRGLLLSVPVLIVLVPLLASADAVFATYVTHLSQWLRPERFTEQAARLGLVLLTAWLTAGGLTLALTATRTGRLPREQEELPLGFVEAMTVLSSVALVFGAFLGVQFQYLFGGAARVQAVPGLTYAEYARRGFGELVAVAFLTLALVLGLHSLTRRTGKQPRLFAALGSGIVAETLVLLCSAWSRMAAYESAYGATQTRLYVDVFILWLGAALLWLALTLWSKKGSQRFAVGALACAIGFVASLNLLNPDLHVARTNTARWERTGQLDTDALRGLSADARPALRALLPRLTEAQRQELSGYTTPLALRPNPRRNWQSWHATDR